MGTVAGVLALGATAGAVLANADDGARAAKAKGGLAISPVLIEHVGAAPGAVDTITVANRSGDPLDIEVAARPWKQSSSGRVSPNRRSTLSEVTLSEDEFTLAPNATRQVTVTLRDGASLYGALEVVGLPPGADKSKGVVTGYRLVGPLRYHPAVPEYRLRTGSAKIVGRGKHRELTLRVRNSGNTITPVSGSIRLRGPLGTSRRSIKDTKILPGKTVRLPLMSARRMRAGRYTAKITLEQATERFRVNKKIRVRR
jgi:hypothetical protein